MVVESTQKTEFYKTKTKKSHSKFSEENILHLLEFFLMLIKISLYIIPVKPK